MSPCTTPRLYPLCGLLFSSFLPDTCVGCVLFCAQFNLPQREASQVHKLNYSVCILQPLQHRGGMRLHAFIIDTSHYAQLYTTYFYNHSFKWTWYAGFVKVCILCNIIGNIVRDMQSLIWWTERSTIKTWRGTRREREWDEKVFINRYGLLKLYCVILSFQDYYSCKFFF